MSLKKFGLFVVVIAGLVFRPMAYAVSAQAKISQTADSLSLELGGLSAWDYDVQRSEVGKKTKITFSFPQLDKNSIQSFLSLRSPLVEKVELDPQSPDQKTVLSVTFKTNNIEAFDYLTDAPSRLIVDIFTSKKKASTAKVEANEDDDNKEEKEPVSKKTAKRAPSSEVLVVSPQGSMSVDTQKAATEIKAPVQAEQKGIFDGGDPEFKRFTIADYEIKDSALIAAQENIYIDFPMLRMPLMEIEDFEKTAPVYKIHPKETQENKEARLLQTLFERKRYNVFLKTVDWFNKKYPQSEYSEIVDFMTADTQFALWQENGDIKMFDRAMTSYGHALIKYPNSALAERTQIFMGFANMDRGDYVSTLRTFKKHINQRPQSPRRDLSRLAIAEAFLKINKYDDALETYNELVKDSRLPESAIQAQFLKGDVHYQNKEFEKAVEAYDYAIKNFPPAIDKYPSAVFNRASALFWMRKYKDSLAGQVDFLKRFPNHEYAAFAMTRAGEIMQIFGAEPRKVTGAYLETYFRYGESPSAYVARIRLISGRMKDMKVKEVEKSVSDIMKLVAASKLEGIEQFSNVLISDGFNSRKEYDRAIDLLVKYYQAHPTTIDANLFNQRIVKNINDKLRDQVKNHDFIQAMKTHQKFADTWLRGSDRVDTQYFLSNAYEDAGVPHESEKLLKTVLNRMLSLQKTDELKRRSVLEYLPTVDLVRLRLAQVSNTMKKYSQSYDELKEIEHPEQLPEKNQVERVQLMSEILDRRGEQKAATRYLVDLINNWKGIPSLVSEPYFTLGQMELKLGRKEDAIKSFTRVDELMQDSQAVDPVTHARALELQAQAYMDLGRKEEALQVYNKLLEQYEKTRPLTVVRYRAGLIHFERGELKKASEVWQGLESQQNGFWYRIAQEKLKGAEWRDDYKKYIQRIPAMVNKK